MSDKILTLFGAIIIIGVIIQGIIITNEIGKFLILNGVVK